MYLNQQDTTEDNEESTRDEKGNPTADDVKEGDLVKEQGPRINRFMSIPDEDTAARREADRTKVPFFYCRWVVNYPKTTFCVCLLSSLFLMFSTFGMIAMGIDVLPIVFERLPLDIRDNEFYLRALAWSYKDDENTNGDVEIYKRGSASGDVLPERSVIVDTATFMFETPQENILTPEWLRSIKTTEDFYFGMNDYQNNLCHMTGGTCSKVRSITQLFDSTFALIDHVFNDTNYENIEEVLVAAANNSNTKMLLNFVLPTDATVEPGTASASILRSSMSFGFPLRNFSSDFDNITEVNAQQDILKEFLLQILIPEGEKMFSDGISGMNFNYLSGYIFEQYITNQVFRDMALLLGSLLFIFLFMVCQTKSLFITGFAILSIITSFFIANLLYRFIFDNRYFGVFHVLALFIILGIGADDIFVFYDTWRETGHYKFQSLAHRLSYAYRKAAFAMFWTSLTSTVAFVVSASSPFLGVSTFGVFAGLLVFVNYMSVIIFFPTIIIVYHKYFQKFKCCCCCPDSNFHPDDVNAHTPDKKNVIVRFFALHYFELITERTRYVIVALFTAMLIFFVVYAAKVRVQEEQVKFLREDTNFGSFIAKSNHRFNPGDYPQRIFIIWGLKQQDLSDCHPSESMCFGKTVWDDEFDIHSAAQQQSLLDFCDRLENLSEDEIADLRVRIDVVTGKPEVYCFPKLMQEFMEMEQNRSLGGNARYENGTDLNYPVDEFTASKLMNNISYVFNSSRLPSSFDRWFEIGLSTWLHKGFFPEETLGKTYETYQAWLGMQLTNHSVESTALEEGILPYSFTYGTRIRYAAIVVNVTLNPENLGYLEGTPVRDNWENFVQGEMEAMPNGLKNGFQCTPVDFTEFDLWHWFEVQRVLVSSAVQGIIIGLVCAVPILIIATMNVVVGLMAAANIACITITVLGFIPLLGWKLGIMESLNLVLVVGLSVDYCVHLAEGYSRSKHEYRTGRLRDALQEVGVSVLSGCVTSVGASSFMLLAIILFFTQFGTFLFITLIVSYIYSIGFFCTCLGIFGPEHSFGSLHPLLAKIRKYWSNRNSQKKFCRNQTDI